MINCFGSIENYLEFYGLKISAGRHEFVPFKSNGFELAGHVFKPVDYKATVVVLHGFLNHCGLLSKLIKYLTEAGFAVAVFDLPGHGLSDGRRTDISDFSQYSDSLNDFMDIIKTQLHGPYHIIGHSTGAAAVMDYLFSQRGDCFGKVILTAPLVHCAQWFWARIAYGIYRHFAENIFRLFPRNSSDENFLRFVKYQDPLQSRKISLNWIGAMFKWNRKIAGVPIIGRPILVIQGKSDTTVAWRYNLKFIQSKFGRAEIKLIKKGQHELLNESEKIQELVFSLIDSYLEN